MSTRRKKQQPAPSALQSAVVAATPGVSPAVQRRAVQISELTDSYCSAHFDQEFRDICRQMVIVMANGGAPLLQGAAASWGAGVIYAVAKINQLSADTQPKFAWADIAGHFDVAQATILKYGGTVLAGFNPLPLDPRFVPESRFGDDDGQKVVEIVLDMLRRPSRDRDEARMIDQLIAQFAESEFDRYEADDEDDDLGESDDVELQPRTDVALQFKITLQGSRPPVWRRIQIADGPLADLHYAIQGVMGWLMGHLHVFDIDDEFYSAREDVTYREIDDSLDADNFLLSELLPTSGRRKVRWEYIYDFGDDWHHEVLFEGFQPYDPQAGYPVCLAGARACPPEDCGGVWEYGEILEQLAGPPEKRDPELMDWLPEDFDPAAFDPAKATERLRRFLKEFKEL